MPLDLDAEGLRMLAYLIRTAPSVDPEALSGLPTRSAVHTAFGRLNERMSK